ncbi:MAG: ATP-binding protein [Gammaproteobacteria bacterium]
MKALMIKEYTDAELVALLDDLESDRVERKSSFKDGEVRKRVRETVCAFSNNLSVNSQPGVLFIGAEDNGHASNLLIDEELLNNLAHIKADGTIQPLPVLTVQKRHLKGADMAVVTVYPADAPPVRYAGRTWVRTGARLVIANEHDERILVEKRRYKDLSPDLYPLETAQISDLSRMIFNNEYLPAAFAPDILASNNRSYEQQLAACRMIASVEDPRPTLLGLLAIGIRVQDVLPGAHIQILRINGEQLTDEVIDHADIGGTLPDQLRGAEQQLQSYNSTRLDAVSHATHRITPDYPISALRQLLYNAVFHRTYLLSDPPVRIYWFSNRIEIHSPGGPCHPVTEENFGQGYTGYRNPHIGEVLRAFGFVQAFGRGIAIAQDEMQKNSNPPIEFQVDQSHVLCTLRAAQ